MLLGRLIGGNVKKNLWVSISLYVLTYSFETWTASEGDLLGIKAMEISSLTMAMEVGRMKSYNTKMYEMRE